MNESANETAAVITAEELQSRLDRMEALLAGQQQLNKKLMRQSRLQLAAILALIAGVVLAVGMAWGRVNTAFEDITATCEELSSFADSAEEALTLLDSPELRDTIDRLPEMTQTLESLDVDSMNETLEKLPGLMDKLDGVDVESLVNSANTLSAAIEKLRGVAGLGALLGLAMG